MLVDLTSRNNRNLILPAKKVDLTDNPMGQQDMVISQSQDGLGR